MNDFFARSSAVGPSPVRLSAQFEAARNAGAWMPWAGAGLAVLLWGGIGAWLFATLGSEGLMQQPPLMIAGGSAALLSTGLTLVCAGVMAREGARSARANQIVLTSARLLLEPVETARGEVTSLAGALSETRALFDSLKEDIETSVTGAIRAAGTLRIESETLVQKLAGERHNMTQEAQRLHQQSDELSRSIPRLTQMMTEATRTAGDQVREADAALDRRLRDLRETASQLAGQIGQLDTMGAESRKRAQVLGGALSRLDEQLVQSSRMVDTAARAGELAVAAARSTAESLRDGVSDALGSALRATETINASAARAAEEASVAMSALRDAGVHAEATTRAAAHAAKQHAEETEKHINQLSETLFATATRATRAAEEGLERARQRIERASYLIGRMKEEPGGQISCVDDLPDSRAREPSLGREGGLLHTPGQAL